MKPTAWGIWIESTKGWMCFTDGSLFWSTSRAMAEAQLKASDFIHDDGVIVREFTDDALAEQRIHPVMPWNKKPAPENKMRHKSPENK